MPQKLLQVLKKNHSLTPPLWLMRQAGRYLPEYKEIRKKAGNFLDLCYNSDLAYEVTMQPIRRFHFDAAILFSDILVVPDALGMSVRFEENKGPLLDPLTLENFGDFIEKSYEGEKILEHLSPAFQTLKKLRRDLPQDVSLIGFCGAPWTLATYMIAGKGTNDQAPARLFGYRHNDKMKKLLETLADINAKYLIEQIRAGADVVQIFDSWAGVLTQGNFEEYCIKPIKRMVTQIKSIFPEIPIIAFPKGAGYFYSDFSEKTGVDAVSLDWTYPLKEAKKLQEKIVVQGNLDPLCLLAGGEALKENVSDILKSLKDRPFIFNLGHGILPQTPISHVEELIRLVREEK